MKRRLAHLLALITASSTMLVGIPFLVASLSCPVWPECSISTAPADYEPAGESRGESCEEEREEEVESKVHLLAGGPTGATIDMLCRRAVEPIVVPRESGPQRAVWSIRGPPVA